jgi:predicted transcriptional regulator of viral defense system
LPERRIEQTSAVRKGSNDKSNVVPAIALMKSLFDCASRPDRCGVRSGHAGGRWPRA